MVLSEITELFSKSQDPEELKHLWVEWHKEAGAKARHNFTEYVTLYNEAAKMNGKAFHIYNLEDLNKILDSETGNKYSRNTLL